MFGNKERIERIEENLRDHAAFARESINSVWTQLRINEQWQAKVNKDLKDELYQLKKHIALTLNALTGALGLEFDYEEGPVVTYKKKSKN